MNEKSLYVYIAVAVFATNLIRILPVTIIRKRITNTFLRSFLYYVPYVTLAVMTFPAIIEATTPVQGLMALAVGIIAAWVGLGLLPVSIICCLVVFLTGLIM